MSDEPLRDSSLATDLAGAFARLSGVLLSEQTVRTALDLVIELAFQFSPSTAGVGVSLLSEERKLTTTASDPLVQRADALQYELDEGPCLAAWRQRQTVRVDDMTTESRWPLWTAAVEPLGFRASLSAPLIAGGETLGAIKLYSDQPHSYTEHDETVLALFGRQAAVLLANVQSYESNRQLTEQLKEALTTRDLIGQAKGIIMAEHHVDDATAFAMLVRLSQQGHEKLRDVARHVVANVMQRSE
jgi:GAF domain-containing protein